MKLTHVKGGLEWLSWDPAGRRISFTRLGGGGTLGPRKGSAVMQVNADGTCLTQLRSLGSGIPRGAAWQPGPGREAGPISC